MYRFAPSGNGVRASAATPTRNASRIARAVMPRRFSNKSTDILELCGAALDQLGVQWRYARWDMISVAKRDAVARLDEFVGPKY